MSKLTRTRYHLDASNLIPRKQLDQSILPTILIQLQHIPKPHQQNAPTLHLLSNFLLPLLIHRDTRNKHQTPTLASKRTMPHPGFPVRIGAL